MIRTFFFYLTINHLRNKWKTVYEHTFVQRTVLFFDCNNYSHQWYIFEICWHFNMRLLLKKNRLSSINRVIYLYLGKYFILSNYFWISWYCCIKTPNITTLFAENEELVTMRTYEKEDTSEIVRLSRNQNARNITKTRFRKVNADLTPVRAKKKKCSVCFSYFRSLFCYMVEPTDY